MILTRQQSHNGEFSESLEVDFCSWLTPGNQIEIEVGCSKGAFILPASSIRRKTKFIGIERSGHATVLKRRVQKWNTDNVLVAQMDARDFFRFIVPNNIVNEIHIYFPTPMANCGGIPILNLEVIKEMHRSLRFSGCIRLATDSQKYFKHITECFNDLGFWFSKWQPYRGDDGQCIENIGSFWEKRMYLNERKIYRTLVRK